MSLWVQMCVLVRELVCECVCDRLSFCLQGAGLAASLLRVSSPARIFLGWTLALGGVPGRLALSGAVSPHPSCCIP